MQATTLVHQPTPRLILLWSTLLMVNSTTTYFKFDYKANFSFRNQNLKMDFMLNLPMLCNANRQTDTHSLKRSMRSLWCPFLCWNLQIQHEVHFQKLVSRGKLALIFGFFRIPCFQNLSILFTISYQSEFGHFRFCYP